MHKISEKNVARLWMSGRLANFSDDLGNCIEVICPGRISTGPGCDFQDAVIRVNRQKFVGDIEVHVTSDLWLKHGHHKDPACNGVILHVAMWQKGGLPVKLQDGRVLPTVILSHYIINVYGAELRRWEAGGIQPCVHSSRHSKAVDTILLIEGLRRLEERAARFSNLLKTIEAGQVLYKGICRALGYARNKAPFEALADRLPLQVISGLAANSLLCKQAVLLGAAGLLPSQRRVIEDQCCDDYMEELESRWSRLSGSILPGKFSEWSLNLVRPVNYPVRRIAALSYLLQRYEGRGLLQGLKRLAGNAQVKAAKNLTDSLQVNEDCYWSRHWDFGQSNQTPMALIGKGRAGEIAINVILPFFTALTRHDKDTRLENRVLNTYLRYPASPSNELTRYMSGVLLSRREVKLSACLQQGLMRLYHRYCRAKDCECCPVFISRKQARA
jgi:hypothetical protein